MTTLEVQIEETDLGPRVKATNPSGWVVLYLTGKQAIDLGQALTASGVELHGRYRTACAEARKQHPASAGLDLAHNHGIRS